MAEGTVNTLTDTGETGIDKDDNTSTTYTAGIVCKKTPLTINGAGTLNITSENGNGIKCTNVMKMKDVTLNVSGKEEAAAGHNGVTAKLISYNIILSIYTPLPFKRIETSYLLLYRFFKVLQYTFYILLLPIN